MSFSAELRAEYIEIRERLMGKPEPEPIKAVPKSKPQRPQAIVIRPDWRGHFSKRMRIVQLVCNEYGVTLEQLRSSSRSKKFIIPRFICCFLIRTVLETSYPQIGLFLRKDHTSILNAVRETKFRMENDLSLAAKIAELIDLLTSEGIKAK